MTVGFDAWIESLYPHDREDPGEPPEGVMDLLRATFDARGAVSPDELDEIFALTAMELVHEAVALFSADVGRTSTLTPGIEIYRDEGGSIAVSWDGNYTTLVFSAMRAPEATCEVADSLRDHLVHDLGAAWPVCPTHGFGLNPRAIDSRAVWLCGYRDHVVSTIGNLPGNAGARDG